MKTLILSLSLLFISGSALANDWLVVANKRFIVDTVDKAQLKRIYEGKQMKLYDHLVTPIQQAPETEAFRVFSQVVLNKRPFLAIQDLMARFLSGKAAPPRTFSNDYQVVEWLKGNHNSIGYIKRSSMIDTLKPIFTLK